MAEACCVDGEKNCFKNRIMGDDYMVRKQNDGKKRMLVMRMLVDMLDREQMR